MIRHNFRVNMVLLTVMSLIEYYEGRLKTEE